MKFLYLSLIVFFLITNNKAFCAAAAEEEAGEGVAPEIYKIQLRNNAALSEAERDHLNRYVPQSEATLAAGLQRAGDTDYRFSIVPVYEDDDLGEDIRGTSFIVADSTDDFLLNHQRHIPFNYQYNPGTGKSPRLYLVSNIHVLKPDDETVERYTFEFHFRKRNLGAIRGFDDFKIVRLGVLRNALGIETHPKEDDLYEIDLAWIFLNPLLDKILESPKLLGYVPSFSAFDIGWDFADRETVGNVAKPIQMYGLPDGEADRALNLPIVVSGACATDPRNLHCDTLSGDDSIIDFKMSITDIGGASGSPVIIGDDFSGRRMLLGINFAGTGGEGDDLIGFAIHSKRLKDKLEEKSEALFGVDGGNVPFNPPAEVASGAGGTTAGGSGGGEAEEAYTPENPQRLALKLPRQEGRGHLLDPEGIAELVTALTRGVSVLDLSRNELIDDHMDQILQAIREAGHLDKILVLNVSSNRIRSLSIFNELIELPTFKYLVIEGLHPGPAVLRSFFETPEAQAKGVLHTQSGFVRNARKAGINASLEVVKAYKKEFLS